MVRCQLTKPQRALLQFQRTRMGENYVNKESSASDNDSEDSFGDFDVKDFE